MRTLIALLPFLLGGSILPAQSIGFTQQPVGSFAFNLRDIDAADINGDGAPDALIGSGAEVYWYKNVDGLGNFDAAKKSVGAIFNVNAVFAADMDGDDDLDVIAGTGTSSSNSELVWFKNLDGVGDTFSAKITITTQGEEFRDVIAADFDGDGDLDLAFASYDTDVVAWLRNEDGQGTFSAPQVIFNGAEGARFLSVGDPDADGDFDIFSSSYFPQSSGQYSWYKNTDGAGTFVQIPISAGLDGNNPAGNAVGDLNGDGALDFVGTMYNSDRVYWYRNTDSSGTFSSRINASSDFNGPFTVCIADLDEDSDNDLVVASENDNKIGYLLNNGNGTFAAATTVSTMLNFTNASFNVSKLIATADLDGDGDADILAISPGQNQVVWFKNTPLLTYSSQVQNPACFGEANGAIYLHISGGDPPYTIAWSDPQLQGDTLTGLVAGSYSVTIAESGGSQFINTFNLTQPDSLYLALSTAPATGSENNGSASVSPAGGTPPYTVIWSNGASDTTIQNLAPGLYTVTVADANGCTVIGSDSVKTIVSIHNPLENETVRIFPNPASSYIHLDASRWQNDLNLIEILDAEGKLLQRIQAEKREPSAPILLPETAANVLWLALRLQNGDTIWGKVIVEK